MSASPDLLKGNPKKLFFKYLIPSISATLVNSVYILADSIIIGKGVGSDGIAALNILLPLFSFYFALGILYGVGGGILFSINSGNGRIDKAQKYFNTAFMMLVITAVIIFAVSNIFFRPLMYMLGAADESYGLISQYGRYLTGFCFIFMAVNFFQAFVRNDKAPKQAMAATIAGGITNIILDIVFIYVFHMGMAGGAVATVLGNILNLIILLCHFRSRKCTLKFNFQIPSIRSSIQIFHSGISSFLLDVASGIVILVFNVQILKYLGNDGLVVYSIISNSVLIATSFFNGVSQASQPLVASNFGASQHHRVYIFRRIAAVTVSAFGCLFTLLGLLFPETIINIFVVATPAVLTLGKTAVRLYFTALIFMSLNILFITYLQSTLQSWYALILSLLRGFILCILFIYIFPLIFGTTAIWLVMPATELITMLIAVIFVGKSDKNEKKI